MYKSSPPQNKREGTSLVITMCGLLLRITSARNHQKQASSNGSQCRLQWKPFCVYFQDISPEQHTLSCDTRKCYCRYNTTSLCVWLVNYHPMVPPYNVPMVAWLILRIISYYGNCQKKLEKAVLPNRTFFHLLLNR